MNAQCNGEVKQLIREAIIIGREPMFLFQINFLWVRTKLSKDLISTNEITNYVHRQLASSYLINKLQLENLGEVDCGFRRVVVDVVPNNLRIWLSKSFTNLLAQHINYSDRV